MKNNEAPDLPLIPDSRVGLPAPVTLSRAAPGGPVYAGALGSSLAEQWFQLRRHWIKIAVFTLLVTLLTAVYVLRLPKTYDAVAIVRMDTNTPSNIVSRNAGQAMPATDALLATEADEVKTPAVVLPTILSLHLERAVKVNDPPGGSAFDVEGVPQPVLLAVTKNIKVTRPINSFLLEIHYHSLSPQLSAQVANGLASQLLQHDYITRAHSLLNLSGYMSQQIAALRAQMERSQIALNQFERAHNIVNPKDKFSLMNQRLQTLSAELQKEHARERGLASDLALVRIGSVDALAVSNRGHVLKPLLDAQKTARIKFDSLAAKYGPGNYLYRQARRQLAEIRGSIAREKKHIAGQIQAQAQAVAVQVRLTAGAFARQKAALNAFNSQAVQYSILSREADSDKKIYDALLQRVKDASISAGYHSENLRIVGHAEPNPVPIEPRVKFDIVMALLLSGGFAVMAVLGHAHFDRTFTDPELMRTALGEEVLASLPSVRSSSDLGALYRPAASGSGKPARRPPFSESVLQLRSALLLGSRRRLRSVCVTSAQPREGKSTVSINLASAFALQGLRTVLVDADIRRPEVHRQLELSNELGLSTLLPSHASQSAWSHAVLPEAAASSAAAAGNNSAPQPGAPLLPEDGLNGVLVSGPVPGLWVLPAGPAVASPAELLAIGFGTLLEHLKSRFDMVVVDCPPLLGFADSLAVGAGADAVLVIVRAGATPRDHVQSALDQLAQVRAPIAGLVLNGVTAEMSHYYYYYRDYYQRYYAAEDRETAKQ